MTMNNYSSGTLEFKHQKYNHKTYFSRYVLVHSSGHRGTANPDQNQYRQDKSCSEDPPWQPGVPVATKLHVTRALVWQVGIEAEIIIFFFLGKHRDCDNKPWKAAEQVVVIIVAAVSIHVSVSLLD